MFVAATVIFLYFWRYFTGSTNAGLIIDGWAVLVSTVALLGAVISYLWTPQNEIKAVALVMYLMLAATAGTLIATSDGLTSPFVALWILVGIFAGIFGLWGMLLIFLTSNSYLVLGFLNNQVDEKLIIITVIAGWLPVLASFIIWHTKGSRETVKDRAYSDLASELNQVANKAEVVINAIADGVIAIDSQGLIQLINPAAQQITGWGKQDATTLNYKSVLKLTDGKDQELTTSNDPVYQVLETNKEVETDKLTLVTHSGKKLLVAIVVSPIGQLGSGAIIVFRDVTSEKKQEREQAEFISTASHEMRTPVASIEGYLGLALNPATAQIDEKARDFINKAHGAAQHLGRLFQDLLDVSKADDGRLSNNPKVVDVVEFASTIIEGLRPQAEAKQLRLVFKPQPDGQAGENDRQLNPVFYANIDNDHLREVIANLTENGIKYTPKGDVIVDIGGDNEHIVISVADSGIGIPTEDIPHLFQKFYRVDTSATREIGGTGLGLYLCRRLADVMGGRIWVESQLGKGSTFYLEIPRIDHEEATRLIEAAASQAESTIVPDQTTPRLRDVAPRTMGTPSNPNPTPAVARAPIAQQTMGVGSTVTSPDPKIVSQQLRAAVPSAPPVPARPNTPLSSIEANPNQFTQPRQQNINIPNRQQKL